jgi:hypothetical protein
MRPVKRLSLVALLAVAFLCAGALPASAVGPFGPAVAVLTGCSGNDGDAAIAADGTTRGFAECGFGAGGPIAFFRHKPGVAPFGASTPYAGIVRAVAWDGADSTYVVFEQNGQLKIGKRFEHNGLYAPTTTLSPSGGVIPFSADVVASNGRWWVVWSEPNGPGGEFAHTQLFQRHTLLGVQGKTRITTTPGNIDDSELSLAYFAGRLTLVWTRATRSPNMPGPANLRRATSTGGAWTSTLLATAGTRNFQPDVTVYASVTYVTWNRDGSVWVASNANGAFASRALGSFAGRPSVAVSGGNLFVAWTLFNRGDPTDTRVIIAQRTDGIWTSAQVAPAPSTAMVVLAQGTKARVVYRSDSFVAVRPQT